MRFITVEEEKATAQIIDYVNTALQNGSVLLLVSGGSNIRLAVKVRDGLTLANSLTVGLIDERYGAIGHPDSNWSQLLAAGLNTKDIETMPVMTNNSENLEQAADSYRKRLLRAVEKHDTIIGIFGIGDDGHTSGILLDSSAIDATDVVIPFTGPDFPRVTTTPAAMPLFDHAFLVSYGKTKHSQLLRLETTLSTAEQPAQTLKQIACLTVYSDFESTGHEQ